MTKNKNNNLNKTSGKTPGNNRSMIWLKLVRNRTLAFTIGSVLTLSSISAGLINLSRFTQTASAANAITVNNGYGCGTYNNPNSSNMSFSTGDTNAPSSPQGYSTNCVIDGQIGLPLVFTGVAVESFSATAPTGTFTFDPDGTGPVAGIPGTLSVDTMAPGTFKFTSTDPLTVTTNNVVSNLATLAGPTGGGFTTATNVIAKVNGSSSFSSSSSSSSISSSSMSSSSNSSLSSSSMSSDSSSSMSSSSSLSSSSSSSVSSSSMSSSSSLSSSSNSNNNNSSSVSAVVNSSSNSSVLSSGNSSVLNSSNSNVSGGNSNSTGNSSNSNVSGGNSSNSSSQAPTVPVPANFDPNGDPDGDGIKNSLECPTYNVLTTCADTDGDGIGNFADSDNDGDGIPDAIEARNNLGQPVSPMMVTAPFDTDGDSIPDFIDSDSDNDGISDKNEKGSSCISLFSCTPIDTDGNGVPDYRQIGSNTNSSNSNSNSNGNSVNSNSTGNSVNSTNNSANNSNSTGNSSNSAGVVITQVPVNPATFNPTNDSDGDGIKDGIECPTYSAGYCNSSTPSGVPDFLNNNFPYNTTNSATNSSAKSIITVTGGQFDPNADSDGDGVKNGVECATYASGKCPDSTGTGVADYLNPNYPFKVFYNSSANNSAGNSNSTGNSTNSAGNSTGNSTNSANNSNNSNSLQGLITVNINPNTFDANGDNDGDGIKNGVECATYSQGFCYSSTTSGVPDYLNPNFPYNFNNSSAQANSSAKSIITVINPGTFTPSGDSDGDGIKDSLECPAYQSGKCPDSTGTGVADYLNPNYPFKVVVNNSSANNSGGNNSAGNSTNSANNSNNSGGNNSNFSFSNSFNNNSSANQILTDVGKTTPKGTVPVNPGNINPDGDDNNDGIKNKDQCPSYLMAYCVDADGNGVPDYLQKPKKDIIITPGTFDPEGDDNNDGIKNKDQCPAYLAGKCVDSDGNGVPDFRQTPGFTKINPTTFDPNKDSNNDGVKDGVQCATYANGYCPDTNGNKIPDYLEEKPTFIITNPGTLDPEGDDNNDGIKNGVQCPAYLSGFCPDSNGNGIPDFKDSKPTFIPQNPSTFDSNKDSNNDGIKDGVQCATFATGFCKDSDGNGIPDYLDTAKTVKSPTLYINDPYTCGGSIFGYATASGTEIDYITVTLSKNGQSSPAYTFKVNLDSAGKYNIPVQSNDSSKPFYVVESVYSVNYSVTDKAANTFSGQAYTADIKDAGKCPILPPKAPNANQETPLKKAELQLSRTGGNEFLTILLIVGSVISLAAGYFTVNKNKKTN